MPPLRRTRSLAVLVSAWFALWLAVLLASPLVADAGLQLVCSGSSVQLVQPGQDDTPTPLSAHLGQCPACVQPIAPLPVTVALQAPATAEGAAPALREPLRPRARVAAAPPPARGPPSFS